MCYCDKAFKAFADSSSRGEDSSKGGSTTCSCKKKEASKEGYNVIEDVGKSTSNQYSALRKHIDIMLTRHCKEYNDNLYDRKFSINLWVKKQKEASKCETLKFWIQRLS
eukprot:1216872-Ditylum_brightwellii.AAC.1